MRGSAWLLGLDASGPLNNGYRLARVMNPESAPFWPDFVATLAEAMGYPIDENFLRTHFSDGALPLVRHVWRVLEEVLKNIAPEGISLATPRLRVAESWYPRA